MANYKEQGHWSNKQTTEVQEERPNQYKRVKQL
jgi:hypothetical protein